MAIQVSSILGWKRGTGSEKPKIGATSCPLAVKALESISIIPAYNITEIGPRSDLQMNFPKTIGTVMLRRAQMLQ